MNAKNTIVRRYKTKEDINKSEDREKEKKSRESAKSTHRILEDNKKYLYIDLERKIEYDGTILRHRKEKESEYFIIQPKTPHVDRNMYNVHADIERKKKKKILERRKK